MSNSTPDSPDFFRGGSPFLNVGCGFGRHAIEFGRRGYQVLAIDSSADMIAAARARAEKENVAVEFRQERGELFLSDTKFDAAICLFTSLGQISEWGENRGLVDSVYAALKKGAQFVVEVPQRETAVRALKPSDHFGIAESYTDVTRQYEPAGKVVSEVFRVVTPHGSQTYLLRYHLFDRAELSARLTAAGFRIEAAYGAYARVPLAEAHPIMLLIARKDG
jgi:SAM-dependent methyltransferase